MIHVIDHGPWLPVPYRSGGAWLLLIRSGLERRNLVFFGGALVSSGSFWKKGSRLVGESYKLRIINMYCFLVFCSSLPAFFCAVSRLILELLMFLMVTGLARGFFWPKAFKHPKVTNKPSAAFQGSTFSSFSTRPKPKRWKRPSQSVAGSAFSPWGCLSRVNVGFVVLMVHLSFSRRSLKQAEREWLLLRGCNNHRWLHEASVMNKKTQFAWSNLVWFRSQKTYQKMVKRQH